MCCNDCSSNDRLWNDEHEISSLYSSSRSRFKLIHNEDNFQDGTRCRVLHLESYLHCGRYDQSWWLRFATGLRSRLGDRLGMAASIHNCGYVGMFQYGYVGMNSRTYAYVYPGESAYVYVWLCTCPPEWVVYVCYLLVLGVELVHSGLEAGTRLGTGRQLTTKTRY